MTRARRAIVALAVACGGPACAAGAVAPSSPIATPTIPTSSATATSTATPVPCGGAKLRVRFYDVAQGLAALVDLPDGRRVLVDAGDAPTRAKCDDVCSRAHEHLMTSLARDVGAAPIDLLWITHPHSDHMGGASDVIDAMTVRALAENGLDADKSEMQHLHRAAARRNVPVHVVAAGATSTPLADSPGLRLRAITPPEWSPHCKGDANACSIALRIDYCASSILFTGDADKPEEARLDPGAATLLQVGHHGSETSSTPGFLMRVQPRYAVVSSGKPDEGLNRGYCHPRASSLEALSAALGGARSKTLRAYSAHKCESPSATGWIDAQVSDRLFSTARDGDVVLATTGDGTFARE